MKRTDPSGKNLTARSHCRRDHRGAMVASHGVNRNHHRIGQCRAFSIPRAPRPNRGPDDTAEGAGCKRSAAVGANSRLTADRRRLEVFQQRHARSDFQRAAAAASSRSARKPQFDLAAAREKAATNMTWPPPEFGRSRRRLNASSSATAGRNMDAKPASGAATACRASRHRRRRTELLHRWPWPEP